MIVYYDYDDRITTPPEDDDRTVANCECCGRDLMGGMNAYKLLDAIFCEDCVEYTTLDYIDE